jgi:Ni,Fe-hydrogenase I large subunit
MGSSVYIAPLVRIEGHADFKLATNTAGADSSANWTGGTATVTAAFAQATMFRGWENILYDRHPNDAIFIGQRV